MNLFARHHVALSTSLQTVLPDVPKYTAVGLIERDQLVVEAVVGGGFDDGPVREGRVAPKLHHHVGRGGEGVPEEERETEKERALALYEQMLTAPVVVA